MIELDQDFENRLRICGSGILSYSSVSSWSCITMLRTRLPRRRLQRSIVARHRFDTGFRESFKATFVDASKLKLRQILVSKSFLFLIFATTHGIFKWTAFNNSCFGVALSWRKVTSYIFDRTGTEQRYFRTIHTLPTSKNIRQFHAKTYLHGTILSLLSKTSRH